MIMKLQPRKKAVREKSTKLKNLFAIIKILITLPTKPYMTQLKKQLTIKSALQFY